MSPHLAAAIMWNEVPENEVPPKKRPVEVFFTSSVI